MNNNRNNRRRGRGSNRNQGGSNSANRIDNRARGNAPQLLDKYKKLAQDAQHNGDRVLMEQYLQFADHYFRVIADNKARQGEAKAKRQDECGQSDDDNDDDDGDDHRSNNRRSGGNRDSRDDSTSEGSRGYEGEPIDQSGDEDEMKPRRTRRKPREDTSGSADGEIDAAVLPPAIAALDDDSEAAPKPRRRRKQPSEDSEEAVG